jgi:hypothetical protein
MCWPPAEYGAFGDFDGQAPESLVEPLPVDEPGRPPHYKQRNE